MFASGRSRRLRSFEQSHARDTGNGWPSPLDIDTSFMVATTSKRLALRADSRQGPAELEAAVEQNPTRAWLLKYPGGVAGRYDPPDDTQGSSLREMMPRGSNLSRYS
jgi:hypothetical protein